MTTVHERKIVTTRRHEYAVPTPVSAVNLTDTMNAALKDAKDALIDTDLDTVQVRAYDGAIVVYWSETVRA